MGWFDFIKRSDVERVGVEKTPHDMTLSAKHTYNDLLDGAYVSADTIRLETDSGKIITITAEDDRVIMQREEDYNE